MGRIIALDVGDVRIGIACTDPMKIIASPYGTYTRKSEEEDFLYIKNLCKEKEAEILVCGMPYNMDGTDSKQTEKVKSFIEKLKEVVPCKVDFVDERLSSWEAEQMLLEGDLRRDKRKKMIDKVAASIILDSYLKRF